MYSPGYGGIVTLPRPSDGGGFGGHGYDYNARAMGLRGGVEKQFERHGYADPTPPPQSGVWRLNNDTLTREVSYRAHEDDTVSPLFISVLGSS